MRAENFWWFLGGFGIGVTALLMLLKWHFVTLSRGSWEEMIGRMDDVVSYMERAERKRAEVEWPENQPRAR